MKHFPRVPSRIVAAGLASCLLVANAHSETLLGPPPRNFAILQADAGDGHWDRVSLLEAALLAGGADPQRDVRHLVASFQQRTEPIRRRVERHADVGGRRRIALEMLHDRILVGDYRERCSNVRTALRTGDFNCVSATVLYAQLCLDCGLAPLPACTTTHVFVQFAGEPGCHVQTTSKWGFRASEEINESEVRPLSFVQLVGKIYYNLGVEAIEERRYQDAAAQFDYSMQFDSGDVSARHNLLAALNNGALEAAEHQRFEEARTCLSLASRVAPSHPSLQTNDLHVHIRWVRWLCLEQRYGEALDVLHRGEQRYPDAFLFRQAIAVVYRSWAEHLLSSQRWSAGFQVLDSARGELELGEAREVEAAAIQAAVARLRPQRPGLARSLQRQALERDPTLSLGEQESIARVSP